MMLREAALPLIATRAPWPRVARVLVAVLAAIQLARAITWLRDWPGVIALCLCAAPVALAADAVMARAVRRRTNLQSAAGT